MLEQPILSLKASVSDLHLNARIFRAFVTERGDQDENVFNSNLQKTFRPRVKTELKRTF